jgi:ATP-binding cassette subfamily B protein
VIDSAFHVLLAIVVVLGFATAIRFYYVSWLGERVVADIRSRCSPTCCACPRLLRDQQPQGNLLAHDVDTAIIEQVVGTTVSIALRNTITALGG